MWISARILLVLVIALDFVMAIAGDRESPGPFLPLHHCSWNLQAPEICGLSLAALVGWEVIILLPTVRRAGLELRDHATDGFGLTPAVRRSFDNHHSEQQRQIRQARLVRERGACVLPEITIFWVTC